MHTPTRSPSSVRDRNLRRLRTLTVGTAVAGIAATAGLGTLAARNDAGQSAPATTSSSSTTTTTPTTTTDTTSTSGDSLQAAPQAATSGSGGGQVTSGGSGR